MGWPKTACLIRHPKNHVEFTWRQQRAPGGSNPGARLDARCGQGACLQRRLVEVPDIGRGLARLLAHHDHLPLTAMNVRQPSDRQASRQRRVRWDWRLLQKGVNRSVSGTGVADPSDRGSAYYYIVVSNSAARSQCSLLPWQWIRDWGGGRAGPHGTEGRDK